MGVLLGGDDGYQLVLLLAVCQATMLEHIELKLVTARVSVPVTRESMCMGMYDRSCMGKNGGYSFWFLGDRGSGIRTTQRQERPCNLLNLHTFLIGCGKTTPGGGVSNGLHPSPKHSGSIVVATADILSEESISTSQRRWSNLVTPTGAAASNCNVCLFFTLRSCHRRCRRTWLHLQELQQYSSKGGRDTT